MNQQLDPEAMPSWLATVLQTRHNCSSLIAGVNDDDCAVLQWGCELLVVTTDYVNSSPICIELGIGDLTVIGRLAIAANLSDLLGTGAIPRGMLIAIMMPRDSTTSDFIAIMDGARHEAERWGVPIVGGDTKLGKELSVCGTAIGHATAEDRLFLKHRARAGDGLWVSGQLGSCSAAVLGLAGNFIDVSWRTWAIDVLTSPQLPFHQSAALSNLALHAGGTDISDGLGVNLTQMCDASSVGAEVYAQDIPVAPEAAFAAAHLGLPPWSLAFGTGGEFQFLASAPAKATPLLKSIGLRQIGRITQDKSLTLILPNNGRIVLPQSGHRDGRRLPFAKEVDQLVREAAKSAQ